MSKQTKPNGRRRWRKWAKSARWGSEYNWNTLRRHPDVGLPRLEPPPLPSPPWSARSLVGMSEACKKRKAWRLADLHVRKFLAADGSSLPMSEFLAEAAERFRIGGRLRLCGGCLKCQPSRQDWCWYEFCDGSGVVPARKAVRS